MRKVIIVVIIAALLSIATACSNSSQEVKQTASENQKVIVQTVKSESVVKLTELSGLLRPSEETIVAFEIPGKIKNLNKKEGDFVTNQDVLALLDAEGYALGVEQANANVRQADAGLKEVNKGAREQELLQAQAMVGKAEAAYQKALDDFKRIKVLYQEGAVAQSNYEAASTGLTVAEKDLTLAKQSYSLAVEGATPETKDRAAAGYQLAATAKKQATLTLSKTQLKAPFSGIVVNKLAADGQLISAGMPVYRIGVIDKLKVTLPVPDYEIKNWKAGEHVTLVLYKEEREGLVTNIPPATSQATGTVNVEITVDNPKHDWLSGQLVTAKRKVVSAKALYLPVEAVISRGEEKPYVFKAEGNKAIKTPVQIGQLTDNKYQIISGLKEGDQVIMQGADRLYNGQLIDAVRGN